MTVAASVLASVPAGTMADVAVLSTRDRSPLEGRDDELRLLLDAVAAAGEGRPAAVLLGGDAGVGKTRLLAEVVAGLPGALVLRGSCVDLGDVGLPYLPFVEAVADLVRQVPATAGVPGLAPLLPAGGAAAPERLQLFEGLVAALRIATDDATVVLVMEDLHWADASSRELLRYLLTRLRDERVAVLASYRADDLHRRHPLLPLVAELSRLSGVEHLVLAPLADDAVRRHVRALGDLPPDLVSAVVERAEGNAYFAEELAQAALDTGRRDLPTRLSDVLLARLARLSDEALGVVRLAAAAGRRVQHELLAAACLDPGLDAALREAISAHVLEVGQGTAAGAYAFRHALLQETVYDDLLPGERVRLHGLLARALADAGDPGELAFHRERSGDAAGAVDAYLAAGDDAMGRGAAFEALASRERALALIAAGARPDLAPQERQELLRRAAKAARLAGDSSRAIRFARERVATAAELDLSTRAEARADLVQHLLEADREAEALDQAMVARELARESGDTGLVSRGEGLYARALWQVLDRDDEVRTAAEASLQAAREAGLTEQQADALTTLGALDDAEGDREGALGRYAEAREVARQGGNAHAEVRAAYNLTAHSFYAGDLAVAHREAEAAARRADDLDLAWSPYGISVRSLLSVIRYTAGDLDGSLDAACPCDRGAADPARENLAAVGLYAAVARGDAEAVPHVLRVMGLSDVDPMAVMIAAGTGADALRAAGDPARGSALAQEGARRIAESWGEWSLGGIWLAAHGIAAQADLAQAARDRHDGPGEVEAVEVATRWEGGAQETARRGRPRGGELGPEGRAWLLRTSAELSRAQGKPDVDLWRSVVEAYGYGYVYEEARARARLGEALLQAGAREEATVELVAAHATALRLDAEPLRREVEALARRGRVELPGVRRAAGTAALTARELEVLRLVAAGLTNRQVGARLFMSEKTASVHVSRILAKLGVSGRAEAAATAARLGLL